MHSSPHQSRTPDRDQQIVDLLPIIFVLLCSVLGILYVFTTPPLQVPDEFAHLFRAYGLSEGYFVAPVLTPVPVSVSRLTSQFPPHLETVRKTSVAELLAGLRDPLRPQDVIRVPNEGMNVNTWIPYIPSALIIFFARLLHASPLALFYLGRLANLAGFIVLTWMALRCLPSCRLALFAISLMPTVIHQASGLSWDSISFGIAFLFCALVLQANSRPNNITKPEYRILWIAVVIVSLCKMDFALLPLIFLIPTSRYGSRKQQGLFFIACAVGVITTNMLWQLVNHENLLLFKQAIDRQYHTNFPDNIWYLYYNTGYLINALWRSLLQTGFMHLNEFVGTFGWLVVRLPPYLVYLYVALLFSVGIASLSKLRLSWGQRTAVLCVVVGGCFGATLAMWLETPVSYIHDAILQNVGTLYGIQGRHYIPFALPALLLLSNRVVRIRPIWLVLATTLVALAVNIMGLAQIRQTYYASLDQRPQHAEDSLHRLLPVDRGENDGRYNSACRGYSAVLARDTGQLCLTLSSSPHRRKESQVR